MKAGIIKKSFSFLFFIMICNVEVWAQEVYTGSFKETAFKEVVLDLESRYDLVFYYQDVLDSTLINLEFSNISLTEVLFKLSTETGSFFYNDDNLVVATGDYLVQHDLSNHFFDEAQENELPVSSEESVFKHIRELIGQEKEEVLEKTMFYIGEETEALNGNSATIVGYVVDRNTGEPIIGATVFKKNPLVGVATDLFGYYSLSLPKGQHEILINSTGMNPVRRNITLYGDGQFDIDMNPAVTALKEVVVTAEENQVDRLQTGFARLDMKTIKQIPSVMGESDIMKLALTIPGVKTVGEGASGFNVRGGSADQNLVLLSDVPVYNTSHLFGFFSIFNPDVISNASLYKSGIDASYGGRIASVFDVQLRDGNKKKFSVKGGISPMTGKLTLEGPIKKDESSFIVGLRSTYSDWLLSLVDDPIFGNSSGSFSDIVAKISHRPDENNAFSVSTYHSRDHFRLGTDSTFSYFNSAVNLMWRHVINNALHITSSISYANYNFNLGSNDNPATAFDLRYNIDHYTIKTSLSYSLSERGALDFGLSSTLYQLQPGEMKTKGDSSLVIPVDVSEEKGLENAIYADYEYSFSDRLSASLGLRVSNFNRLGPGKSFGYSPGPQEVNFISDTISYGNNDIYGTYVRPEWRFSGRYKLRDDLSLKVSYDLLNQYLHVLSNTTSISPTDTWRLSSPNIRPQTGSQYSIGVFKTLLGTSIEFSLEGYYKRMQNVQEYKDGADLQLNEVIETDIIPTQGKAYGAEFLVKKNSGQFTGWLSYTYSRSLLRTNSDFAIEQINSGEYYPANYDMPHSLVLISNYKFNRRFNFSFNVNYSTGRPATYPIAKFNIRDQPVLYYTNRNQYRIPDYFRMDTGINIEGNHRADKKIHSSISISVYNLLGRRNAYSVFFRSNEDQIQGYKMSIFGAAIPTITYHFEFR